MSSHDREQGDTAAAPTATSDGLFDRREFVQIGSTAAAAAALVIAGCQPPAETSKAFNQQPEAGRTQGKPRFYNTVLDGAPVTVRAREGRPILITPNADAKLRAPFSVREQAALLDLYDPDRVRGPQSVRRGAGAPAATDWKVVTDEVTRRLKQKAGDAVLLTGPLSGPATLALVAEVAAATGLRHVAYSPYGDDAVRDVVTAAFPGLTPRPRLDRANLIVGFGADFLEDEAGLERDFATRRDPAHADGMSRFVQLEGRLSLTGANADGRIRVRTSQLALVAAGVANALIVGRKLGPQAANATVVDALSRYAPDAVAKQAGIEPAAFAGLVDELAKAGNGAAVLAGANAAATVAGRALAAAVLLINDALGSYTGPAFELVPAAGEVTGGPTALAELADAMRAKKVGLLIIAGVNPVFDAPTAVDFAGAMTNTGFIVSLNDRLDETSKLADLLAPMSHSLESWADADLGGGQVAVQQPVLRPLFDTHGLTDILVSWGALSGAGGNVALAAAAASAAIAAGAPTAQPTPANVKIAGRDSPGYHYVKGYWLASIISGEQAWDATLRRGWAEKPGSAPVASPLAAELLTKVAEDLGTAAVKAPELEVELYPHLALYDGKSGNNGWLHELPDPITRLTWGNVISIAPRRFDAMKLEDGELLELKVGDAKLVAPAYRHAGMHQDQVAIALGLGRTACGAIGANSGVNAFVLQGKNGKGFVRAGLAAALTKVGGKEKLARGQGNDVIDRKPRPIVPVTTLSAYKKNPAAGVNHADEVSAWPEHQSKTQQWGMAIDLAKCTGCAKCVVGCQAENNIPVVGKRTVSEGRGMWWLRIDRYYDAPEKQGGWGDDVWDAPLAVVEEPVTLFEPMLCQQCGHAPCETVCPFNATMHSSDGLNQQVYNRCVGTRYCANNCPYKVRRYNWFEYSEDSSSLLFGLFYPELKNHSIRNTRAPIQMKNNPEVTVRSRGVMEKCSFCVQRIREANAEAIRDGHKGKIADGAVVPACAEVCPSNAIVFGDLNDPNSRVSKLAKDPRAMRVLADLGTKPSISYLTKVRHDHA